MAQNETPRVQDDLYGYVNGAWQQTAAIDPDRVSAGVSTDLDKKVEKELLADLKAALAKAPAKPKDNFDKAAVLFGKALDFDQRDREGLGPILPRLAKIQGLPGLAAFNAALPELIQDGYALPFYVFVETDMHDATKYQVMFTSPDTILPDVTMYDDPTQKQALLPVWEKMARLLLAQSPLNPADQEAYVKDALAFDARIAAHHLSHEDAAVDDNLDNPAAWDTTLGKLAGVAVAAGLKPLLPSTPRTVNIIDTKYYQHFSDTFNADTFTEWQHWAYVDELVSHARYLSRDLRKIGELYNQAITGQQELTPPERFAYNTVIRFFAEPVGVFYGKKYFGPQAKADVTHMVEDLITTYKQQIHDNTWLSDQTKAMAVKKLDTMVIKMGYPEKARPLYDRIAIDQDTPLTTTLDTIAKVTLQYSFARLNNPVDRSEWVMPAQIVNAAYNPTANDITFPAGILQAPFYDVHASQADNLGGAGATIGHEISHAFDNNGALYDEHGNKKNWWQPADFAHFKKYTEEMIAQFDGIPYAGGKINGKLVVSENIADNAGLNAALQILHRADAPASDFQEYFINYARSWRTKIRPEFERVILKTDVHAPALLRTNVPVPNFPEWYSAFHVKQGDTMYREPAKRVVIW